MKPTTQAPTRPSGDHLALSLLAVVLLFSSPAPAQTILDTFADASNWVPPFTEPGKDLMVTNGRMNFTSSTTTGGGSGILRSTPSLTTTQSWSITVDVHIDAFAITNENHGVSVFLGVGKSSDPLGTHLLLGFDRDWWEPNFYGVNDDVQTNGVSVPGFFNVNYLPSPDATLRLDYNAGNQTISYYCDPDGIAGVSGWTLLGSTNIASGTYNLHLGLGETLSVLLGGWSELQVVTNGQAYFDNLEVTWPATGYAPDSIAGYTVAGAITNINGSPFGPAAATNFYSVTNFSQAGPNADNTYSGTYTYVKTGPNTGSIFIYKTAPPDQAGEQTTNQLVFGSPQSGTFAHYYDFIDTPPTVQYGTFQVVATNGLTGSLQVNITPVGAVTAGAQWQVDGGGWQNSGAIVSGLTPGNHLVNFKTIPNWGTPASQTVIIASSAITFKSVVYSGAADYVYTTNNGVLTITGYIGAGGDISIPGTINGLSVAKIGAYALERRPSLTSVTIPASVTNILLAAFWGCSNLTTITLPAGVISIESYAFGSCAALTNVTIPSTVTNLQGGAFCYCVSLPGFNIDSANPTYTASGGIIFNKPQTTLLAYPAGLPGPYSIPPGITNIGVAAFAGCSRLTGLTIGPDVLSISNGAFESCSGLTNLTISSPVRSIQTGAFSLCTGLQTLTIAGSVTNIADFAFVNCFNMRAYFFLGNAPALDGGSVFLNDTNSIVYYLPGTTGWGTALGARPTALWNPTVVTSAPSFGVHTNRFGFTITGTANIPIAIEAAETPTSVPWTVLQSGTLTNGFIYFSDAQWTNHPSRVYRIRSP